MIKKVLILPDAHITTKLPKPYRVVKPFIKHFKPDEIILLGDFMDVSALSAWDLDKKRLMEGRRYMKEIEVANEEIAYLLKYSKKITYLEGNHEDRVNRYLDKHPEMEGLLEIPTVLGLKDRGIEWIGYNKLYQLGHLYFTHGCYHNKYYTQKTLDSFGCNIVVGHLHKPQMSYATSKMEKSKACWGLGCLSGMEPEYMKGRPAQWGNGFAVAYVNDRTGQFNIYPVEITDNKFMWAGREWK